MQGNQKNQQQSPRVEIIHTPTPQEPTDIDLLAVIERRNEMMSRILEYAIRSTHPGQWVNQQGKPYPTAPAAEVMARRCAVSIKNVQTNKVPSTDDKGPFYMYVVTATAALPGGYDSIEAMGTCSSRDSFLGTETKAGRPLSDIDEGNILKAAYSNMLVNAITRLLGVRNLTWERLAELGISQDGVAKVEYQTGAKGGGEAAHDGERMKFGSGKGKTIAELKTEELDWYAKAFERDLADASKAKWHDKTRKQLDAIKAEHAKRSGAKPASGGGAPAATPHDRIRAAGEKAGFTGNAMRKLVWTATGKVKDFTEEDVGKVEVALAAESADVPQ